MNEPTNPCLAVTEGVDCTAEAAITSPVPLCDKHRLQVALLVVPDLLASALRDAQTGVSPVPLAREERAAVIAGARPVSIGNYMGGVHGAVVYFIENGHRVKIGHSTNMRGRVRALSLQQKDILLLLQGGLTLERALHDTFKKERIDSTEWFVKSERIINFVESKRAELRLPPPAGTPTKLPKRAAQTLAGVSSGRRTPAEWAVLAEPLYRKHLAEYGGKAPSGRALQDLLRDAYPSLPVPGSDRWGRNLRADVEKLIGAAA